MPIFDVILWDVDGTLLNFLAAEDIAMRFLFQDFGLGECSDSMVKQYSRINDLYWKKLESGEMTRAEILVKRFDAFFQSVGIDSVDGNAFNIAYQKRLGETVVFSDNAFEVVSLLKGKIPQYVVSNGTIVAQTGKLTKSGLIHLMDGIFLSERLGAEKPSIDFFNQVFKEIKPIDKSKVLIVGDSLTSDIAGGINAGIKTCWFNPLKTPNQIALTPDYEIENLKEILSLLDS